MLVVGEDQHLKPLRVGAMKFCISLAGGPSGFVITQFLSTISFEDVHCLHGSFFLYLHSYFIFRTFSFVLLPLNLYLFIFSSLHIMIELITA